MLKNKPGKQPASNPGAHHSTSWTIAGLTYWFPYVVFYAVLANIPMWLASHWIGMYQNGLFCLEYMAIGLIALFVPRFVGAALLFAAILLDVITGISLTYFLTLKQLFGNLNALTHLPLHRIVTGVAAIVVMILFSALAAYLPVATIQKKFRLPVAAALVALALAFLSADTLSLVHRTGGISSTFKKDVPSDDIHTTYYSVIHLSRVPSFRLAKHEIIYAQFINYVRSNGQRPIIPVASATDAAVRATGLTSGKDPQTLPNLVVVVVESWGLDNEDSVNKVLEQPYTQPALLARYQVLQGTVPHFGSTVPGEVRELCDNSLGFSILDATAKQLHECLPARLSALGYSNVALHGMSGQMFNRTAWYPGIGFHEILFQDQLIQQGLPNCKGAFIGICDSAIAQFIGERLAKKSAAPEFMYWMTLNSHIPVLVPSPLANGADCSASPSISQQPILCSWYQLIANVHQSVSTVAMGNLSRPTIFVIVGDHAPPFSEPALRSQFSPAVVPYVVLVPRQLGTEKPGSAHPSQANMNNASVSSPKPPHTVLGRARAVSGEHLTR